MQNKRYQVFLSSTYEDLKDERRAVEEVIISSGDFPVGMEAFPAADEDQFEFIKTVIDTCDYYVLIIAGRYGSIASDGLSFTEKEYRYAVSRDVPVLVMLYKDRENLPAKKSEPDLTGKKRLEKFIDEVSNGRLRKEWNSVDSLKLAVREALDFAKATKPRTGWVRGDSTASIDALEELNRLRKENENFKETVGELKIDFQMPEVPKPDDEIIISLKPSFKDSNWNVSPADVQCSWIAVFPIFLTNLDWRTNDWNGEISYTTNEDSSCVQIGSALASEASNQNTGKLFTISEMTLAKLKSYYIEAGFMRSDGADEPFTELGKKVARRQLVNTTNGPSSVSVQNGNLKITRGDDIPF